MRTKKVVKNKFLAKALRQIENEKRIDLQRPDHFNLNMERLLPYLCVYRVPAEGEDYLRFKVDQTEASNLTVWGKLDAELKELLIGIVQHLSDHFGAFLILEIWTSQLDQTDASLPKVRVIGPTEALPDTVNVLADELRSIRFSYYHLQVMTESGHERFPEGMKPLLSYQQAKKTSTMVIGLEIQPFYVNPDTKTVYPFYLRSFRKQLSEVLKKTFYEFIRLHTTYELPHFHVLGTTRIDDVVWEVDQQLAEISARFKFLLLVTPTNIEQARQQFEENNFSKAPVFHYRLLPIDPEEIKRDLFNIPIEKVSDPTLSYFFRDKRNELAKMLTMLSDRDTPNFLYSSMQVYGTVDEKMLDIAEAMMTVIPPDVNPDDTAENQRVEAPAFAERARDELDFLCRQYPDMKSDVQIRSDISGIMVSDGILCISKGFKVREKRVEALIQHEIGTHVLTYWNGKAQPLKQLYSGAPGYEELQEGLAVLSEWLVGGLTNERLRVLAARVVGVHRMINGANFCDTFHLLHSKYQFPAGKAFYITMRIYRGGGLTKDAVYLRGLVNLLQYLKEGNDIEPLLIGKIRPDYVPIIQELIHRGILNPVPMKPRYLLENKRDYEENRNKLKKGLSIFNFINHAR